MDLTPPRELADRWREEAERYEVDGAMVRADKLLRRVAAELTAAWQDWRTDLGRLTESLWASIMEGWTR